jgi:hypothetical protein
MVHRAASEGPRRDIHPEAPSPNIEAGASASNSKQGRLIADA